MLVSQILKSKGDAAVVTVPQDATMEAAAARLARYRIGAVVVTDAGGRPVGILSERDVVRELARTGPELLGQKVSASMTGTVVTCSPDQGADEVLGLMTEGRFRHLPVMEAGEMVGLISIGDVVKARLAELAMERNSLESMIMGY